MKKTKFFQKDYYLRIVLSIIALNLCLLTYKQFFPNPEAGVHAVHSPYQRVSQRSHEPMKVHIESIDPYAFNFVEVPVQVKNNSISIEAHNDVLSVRVENTPLPVDIDKD